MTKPSTNADSVANNEEIELYPDPGSSSSNNDRLNNWLDISVAEEVERGNSLRRNKPPPHRRKNGQPKIVNLRRASKEQKRQPNKNAANASPCGCSHWSTQNLSNSSRSNKSQNKTTRINADNQRKCTIRTAQLAAPTKRHCLDTWRNKSYLLPSVMVDRLKEHVMDQRPIVQISEAIDAFQRRKPRLHKKSTKKKITKLRIQKSQLFLDITTMCLIFAQKVTLRLSRPMNIMLTPELERLARIVSDDIAQLTNSKKIIKRENFNQCRLMHTDVTKKITIWIVGILDDFNYKLLEEDLKDLEEEEGPVLDFLDDVLEKALDISIPVPSIIFMEPTSKYADSNSVVSKDSYEGEMEHDTDSKISNREHFRNEIHSIISNIDKEVHEHILTDKEYFENLVHNTTKHLFKDSIDHIASDEDFFHKGDSLTDKEYFENEIYKIITNICKDEAENKYSERLVNEANNEVEEGNRVKASDEIQEDSDDSKNVMSSFSDMVVDSEINRNILKSQTAKHELTHDNYDNDSQKRNIFFAEPNTNLLSDADEIWPHEPLRADLLRPSASVTKSILSLGKLSEADEKYFSSPGTDSSTSKSKNLDGEDDKEVLKSFSSLVKILHGGQKGFKHHDDNSTMGDNLHLLNPESEMQITLTIASLMNILQNNEYQTPAEINAVIAEKLKLLNVELPDEEATTTLVTLLNTLRGNEELLSAKDTNAYIAEKLALLKVDLQGDDVIEPIFSLDKKILVVDNQLELPRVITSLLKILGNDENLTQELANLVITENLNILSSILPKGKITRAIEDLFEILDTNEKRLTPIETNIHVAKILALLNKDERDDEVTKAIESLVTKIQGDENNAFISAEIEKQMMSLLNLLQDDIGFKLTTDKGNLGVESKDVLESHAIQNMIASFLDDKCNAESQTDKAKVLEGASLVATEPVIASFESIVMHTAVADNDSVQARTKRADDKSKVKSKNKKSATYSLEHKIMQPDNEWKVHLETAPSWIVQTNAHGEPSEDSVPHKAKVKLAKRDVHKWCKNLDRGFKNLEIWSDWLRNTCKQTASLLRKKHNILQDVSNAFMELTIHKWQNCE